MAKIRVRGLGRLLLIVVTVVLALSLGAEAVYGEHASAAPAMNGAGRTAPSGTDPRASDTSASEHPESGSDRCPPRRDGRSAASVSAPTPPVTTVSTAGRGRDRTEGGLGLTAPLTGRQAVPLTRSGELPLQHAVFRC
ncbi:hypothetical protein SAMN05428945_1211 [Streptomyces sp. 2224.1]|uniref:hypothetical protein n=1 Tax=unclassified Streptomyces TaxID=2593676 RepID=UPI00088F0A09|nr:MULTISPECIES: hypothetical protein [unclassified Streptomyces]PBC84165.1 hypothetical protein BX261_4140 [Streptomyces sp. 2321.6]SDR34281.1 hypothetical protein SAMN05216511_3058 [Streptomyces sp. KS_16]SEB80440.1 hypothetical protein SAMN05428945_1211 [Streptomyces sp. 2224.1]SED22003.1 hypothetical protein SAMN05428940_4168 [Streptomyces sp. 2133.1]SEE59655.1 hypothetical protein SAMN05428954_3133 [Streptomyces sp. 2112.3]